MSTDYGRDISCTDDSDPMMTELETDDIALVTQAIFRRLITPRGRLLSDPLYGYDVRQWLNRSIDRTSVASLAAGVKAEALKDERVSSANVRVRLSQSGASAYLSEIDIDGRTNEGPFKLTLGIEGVTVSLLKDGVS